MTLLEQARHVLRLRHFALRTEECYLRWIERYVRFHRTPKAGGTPKTSAAKTSSAS